MVAHRTLTPFVRVRILHPLPKNSFGQKSGAFSFCVGGFEASQTIMIRLHTKPCALCGKGRTAMTETEGKPAWTQSPQGCSDAGAEGSSPALPHIAFTPHCRLRKSCGCRAGRPGFICRRQRRATGHPLPRRHKLHIACDDFFIFQIKKSSRARSAVTPFQIEAASLTLQFGIITKAYQR